jgi:hypothetical protein
LVDLVSESFGLGHGGKGSVLGGIGIHAGGCGRVKALCCVDKQDNGDAGNWLWIRSYAWHGMAWHERVRSTVVYSSRDHQASSLLEANMSSSSILSARILRHSQS